jgi:hypothetical protein
MNQKENYSNSTMIRLYKEQTIKTEEIPLHSVLCGIRMTAILKIQDK